MPRAKKHTPVDTTKAVDILPKRKPGRPSKETIAAEAAMLADIAKAQQKQKEKEAKADKGITRATARKEYEHTFNIPQEELETIPIHAPLSIKQEKFLQDEENDIVVWGGAASAGKTALSLQKVLLGAMWDKDYTATIVRKTQKQMKQPGSLWSSGCKLFQQFNVGKNTIEMAWSFPNGAEVKCHHLDGNQDDHQGSQNTKIYADESQQMNEEDLWYLTSRLRSKSKQKHQLIMTCNPLNTSFLCDWLVKAGYLLESGLPDPERDGQTTYMLQLGGEFQWFKTRKEVVEQYGEEIARMALKFVFYSANVYDNPWVRKHQPTYVHKLEQAKHVERERLLLGNWFASTEGNGFITKDQFIDCSWGDIPSHTPRLRAWDLASTKPHAGYTNPDWTRGILATYDRDTQRFYIMNMVSTRDSSAMVQQTIEEAAREDTSATYQCLPIDPGAAGKSNADQKKARLESMGFKVVLEPQRSSKLQRAELFILAVQEGRVFVAPGVFNAEHYKEIEAFDGAKCSGMKDDIIDALASAYTQLVKGALIPTIRPMDMSEHRRRRIGGRTFLT